MTINVFHAFYRDSISDIMLHHALHCGKLTVQRCNLSLVFRCWLLFASWEDLWHSVQLDTHSACGSPPAATFPNPTRPPTPSTRTQKASSKASLPPLNPTTTHTNPTQPQPQPQPLHLSKPRRMACREQQKGASTFRWHRQCVTDPPNTILECVDTTKRQSATSPARRVRCLSESLNLAPEETPAS